MDYCYFHNRLKTIAKPNRAKSRSAPAEEEPRKFPVPEDRSAILVALAQILNDLSSNALDTRRAGLLIYGLQVASQNVERKQDVLPFRSVQSVSLTREGDEVAPKLRVCESSDLCATCNEKDTCNAFDPDQASEES
jgi:hypothetical protein